MCSVDQDIEDLSSFSKTDRNKTVRSNPSKCKKCGEKSILLLQKKDPFCRKCFFEYCDHKFRSTIGKAKKVQNGEKVLLACSGGRKSAALLHMTKQALESASLKQISFAPGILFIDETIVSPSSALDVKVQVQGILKQFKIVGYPVFYSSLEMVYQLNDSNAFYWSVNDLEQCQEFPFRSDSQLQIKECMTKMSLSDKVDFIKHLRLLLMTEIASHAGYSYLFVGDSASGLAVNLLADISLGRGSQISSDTIFYDSRYKVPVCRPIREFLDKELALYNHLHGCTYTVLQDLLTKTANKSSVQRLTEDFISGLQDEFPATIFTIFRTGGKLSKHNNSVDNETCILCKSKLDNIQPNVCSALEALKLSEKLSQVPPCFSESSTETNLVNNVLDTRGISLTKPIDVENMDILRFLCHGCSIPFRNTVDTLKFLPSFSRENKKMEQDQMKDMIKEFVIDENEIS